MSQSTDLVVDSERADPSWKSLYKIGGAAVLIAVVFFRRNFGAELMGFRGFGPLGYKPGEHPQEA